MTGPTSKIFAETSIYPGDPAHIAVIDTPPTHKPKLLDQVRQTIRTCHYGPKSED
jgi:hypothetical protein